MQTNLRSLFQLDPEVVYLNHGSFGACPTPVFEVYQQWQRELERQPVEFLGRRAPGLMAEARHALADYLGAGMDDIVYMPNATTALNVVARSLQLQPGDEILASDQEYGALDRTWRFVCKNSGSHYRQARIPLPVRTQAEVIEAIWGQVNDHTRVLFLSHITAPTGIILPLAELIQRARARGILTVIDGAHTPGQIDLNLGVLGADFYSGNCHKWMLTPKGSAFLYARPEVQSNLQPLVVSWGWEPEQAGVSRFIDEQEFQGTRDLAAYLTVPAGIEFLRRYDWPQVQRDCQDLLINACQRVNEITGLAALSPLTNDWIRQMAACALPPCDGPALQAALYADFGVEILVTQSQGVDFLRISIQAYNTQSDIDTLVRALQTTLKKFCKKQINQGSTVERRTSFSAKA